MRLTIDLKKRNMQIFFALLIFASGIVMVNAFGTSSPSTFGHSTGEIDGLGSLATKNSVAWSDISGIPSGLSDGDDVNDADANPSNELQDLASVLARGSVGGGVGMSGLGDVYAAAFYYTSDARLKKNIAPIDDAVSLVQGLEGVSFEWNDDGDKAIGLIAQDVEKVIPEVVGIDENGFKSVQYANLVAVLVEAIKEQQKEIDELQKKLNEQ